MNNIQKLHKKLLRILTGGVIISVSILSTLGCSGGGGGEDNGGSSSGNTPTSIKAFNFNANNTVSAAQYAASAMAFFPNYTDIGQNVLNTLVSSNPNNSPFDLARCSNAAGPTLSWSDTDGSGDLSAGDTATLEFNNCNLDSGGAFLTGTLNFTVTSVDLDPLPNSIAVTVSVNLTITTNTDTTKIAGTFNSKASTPNNSDFTIVYTADDSSRQKLTVTENGSTLFKFGCFDVTQTFNVGNSGTYLLAPHGVINVSDAIMSLAGGPALSFVNDQFEAGTQALLSLAVPECAALDVPGGVNNSDGSYIHMDALGGGGVGLHTFDSNNQETYTESISWNKLLN